MTLKFKSKKKNEGTSGQAHLLYCILENHGGAKAVSQKTGLPYSMIANWRKHGYVPLSQVGKLARGLKLNIYAFNYEGLTTLLGTAPKWTEVVKGAELSPVKVREILSKAAPKDSKELL